MLKVCIKNSSAILIKGEKNMFKFKEKITKELIKAVKKEDYKKVKLFIKLGADVKTDNYALKIAVAKNRADIAKLLIDAGSDATANDNELLNWACVDGDVEMVKLLIKSGADVKGDDNSPIIFAATEGHLEVVRLLLEAGADPISIDEYIN